MGDCLQKDHPDQIFVTAPQGACIVFNTHMWHGGMPNKGKEHSKMSLNLFYSRRDRAQQQYQKPQFSDDQLVQMSPTVRWLCAIDDEANDELMKTYNGPGSKPFITAYGNMHSVEYSRNQMHTAPPDPISGKPNKFSQVVNPLPKYDVGKDPYYTSELPYDPKWGR